MTNEEIFTEAKRRGLRAGLDATPTPINVVNNASGATYHIEEGLCGFAWVNVPGNTSFGRWLNTTGYGRKGYPSGVHHWIGEHNQSHARKVAHARAMTEYLRSHGINARSGDRLD